VSRAQLFTGSPWRAPERQAHHYGRAPVTEAVAQRGVRVRAAQIALHLLSDPLPEIDPTVLATNGRTTVIHVLDTAGRVVASSAGAPTTPLVTVHPTAGTRLSVEPQRPKVLIGA